MAIIIPSKNIYSKNINPAIDNNIDRIGINIGTAIIETLDNTNIFNETYTTGISDIEKYYDKRSGKGFAVGATSASAAYEGSFEINTLIDAQVFDQKVRIPRIYSNGLINNVHTGITEDGQTKIQCSIIGKVEEGTVSIQYEGNARESLRSDGYYAFAATAKGTQDLSSLQYNISTLKIDRYEDLSTDIAQDSGFEKSNLDTVTATKVEIDGKEYFELNLSNILVSLTEISGIFYVPKIFFTDYKIQDIETTNNGGLTIATNIYYPKTGTVTCAYKKQKAEQIQIVINGAKIKISFKDKSITIGDGDKVFSFEGNELIQSTNFPTTENKYQEIIDKWKNGKQTATLTCPITDYYDANGNKIIDVNVSGKMLFKEGHIVIPYIYTNDGDKPMSYNKDFTPKQFKVVGTSISKRQGCMQELTLLEL